MMVVGVVWVWWMMVVSGAYVHLLHYKLGVVVAVDGRACRGVGGVVPPHGRGCCRPQGPGIFQDYMSGGRSHQESEGARGRRRLADDSLP